MCISAGTLISIYFEKELSTKVNGLGF